MWARAWSRFLSFFVWGPSDGVYRVLLAVILVAGILSVLTATFATTGKSIEGADPLAPTTQQLQYALLGLALMWLVAHQRMRTVAWVSAILFPIGLVALLMCRYSPWAHEVGKCWAWLKIGSKTVQPSEFVKVLYLVLIAWIATMKGETLKEQARIWLFTMALALPLAGILLFVQHDMGMTFLVAGVTLAMLFLRGLPGWQLGGVAGLVGLGGVSAAMLLLPEKWNRVITFLDPTSDPTDAGYQMCQNLATLARGGFWGLGLGMCPDKWGALPTPHTDSIFCVIGSELGVPAALGMLLLVFLMAARSFRIAQGSPEPIGWFIACGVGLLLGIQSLINIAVATVSMPCTGLTLPFISAGGSSLIASLAAAGLVLAVSRTGRSPKGARP